MHANGLMLHIDCSLAKSLPLEVWRFPDITVPTTLAPTDLQMSLPHPPCMDLLPFATFRDEMVKASAVINPLEFWSDLTSGTQSVGKYTLGKAWLGGGRRLCEEVVLDDNL